MGGKKIKLEIKHLWHGRNDTNAVIHEINASVEEENGGSPRKSREQELKDPVEKKFTHTQPSLTPFPLPPPSHHHIQ